MKGTLHKKHIVYLQSAGGKIYVEFGYPKKLPAPAIIIGHGLRSYFTGFLNMFAKALREAGYTTVKFHFLGTGKSDGKFEDKSTGAMLQNYKDVLTCVRQQSDVTGIGVLARSNAGSLAALAAPQQVVRAYVLLAPPAYYSLDMKKFLVGAKRRGKFFYHPSFQRKHTKGKGRLPVTFMTDLRTYDKPLLANIKKMKPVALFQSTKDEAVPLQEGHFAYWQKHLPQPRKLVLIQGGNHSYQGKKRFVISESIRWFKKYLPPK